MNAIAEELGGSSSNLGHRKMHIYLQAKGIICCHENVRVTLKEPDVEGISLDISKGPNYTWHIDGHDKLK